MAVEEDAEEASRKEDIENSPIVQLVKNIIEQAARQRTSDIHIEPFEYFVKVRYRIDGNLREIMTYDKSLFPAMIARIKILARNGYRREEKAAGRTYHHRGRSERV